VFIARLFHLLKILLHLRLGEWRGSVCHGLPDQRTHERPLQGAHGLVSLLLQAPHSGKHLTQVSMESGILCVQPSIALFGEMPGFETSFEFCDRRQAAFQYWRQFGDQLAVDIMPEEAKMRRQALFKLLQEALFTTLCLLQNLLFTLLELFPSAQCRDILLE